MKKTTLIFVRNAENSYTGQYPEITSKGEEEANKAADEILEIVGNNKNIQIVYSSSPKALGTLNIIAKKLRWKDEENKEHEVETKSEVALSGMRIFDRKAAEEIFSSFVSSRDFDTAYTTGDKRFEDGVFEKRSLIEKRFSGYLGTLFERSYENELPDFIIFISHIEVLWTLINTELSEPLLHGEIITMEIDPCSKRKRLVYIKKKFRNEETTHACKLPTVAFMEQLLA